MTHFSNSVQRCERLLDDGDLSNDNTVAQLLSESYTRRTLDLSDLSPTEQADMIASRAVNLLPSAEALAQAITTARNEDRGLTVKFGIDPTSADVHLGHAVPMIVLSRFQRMGHDIVFIVGDITAKIGDPSGRSDERPALTDADIASNLAGYRDQVSPFFDFSQAAFRFNSQWLAGITLPKMIEILSKIPVSASLQRDDFRTRLEQGQGLAMSEFIYSVVMAIDSAEINADVELGGLDQLLNMQMGRKVMETSGQRPQLVAAMPLIEGTDGTGAKMSKSKGNTVDLTASGPEIFGQVMSIPDRLIEPYLEAWTEWTDAEIARVSTRMQDGSLRPVDVKKVLAGEAVAALQGVDAAMKARAAFTAQFANKTFTSVESLPEVDMDSHAGDTIAVILTNTLGFTLSLSAARRLAKQDGLRLIVEGPQGQDSIILTEAQAIESLGDLIKTATLPSDDNTTVFLKAGRKIARLSSNQS